MVFRSGRGGGQWGLPVQLTPSIGLETAGGGTAGLAQLGIGFCELGGAGGGALSTVVGAGRRSRVIVPHARGLWSIGNVRRHVGVGRDWGFGAGGGTSIRTCRGVRSS